MINKLVQKLVLVFIVFVLALIIPIGSIIPDVPNKNYIERMLHHYEMLYYDGLLRNWVMIDNKE